MRPAFFHKTIAFAALAWIALAAAALPVSAQGPGVYIQPEAWVQGREVHLADIALIVGLDQWKSEIAGIYVGSAPSPGQQRAMRGSWVRAKVERLDLPENAVLEIPPRIKVGRLFQEVQDEYFRGLLIQTIKESLKVGRFQISRFQVHGNGPVPEGGMDVILTASGGDPCYGQVSFRGSILVDGVTERRVTVSAWVDYEAPVVVAATGLDRNTVLGPNDLRLERQNISRMPENMVTSSQDAVGMRIRQDMNEGKVLLQRVLEKPPLVERGRAVTIVARTRSLVVTTLGLAQDSGALGDRITVENVMSEKNVLCRVTGADLVEVLF